MIAWLAAGMIATAAVAAGPARNQAADIRTREAARQQPAESPAPPEPSSNLVTDARLLATLAIDTLPRRGVTEFRPQLAGEARLAAGARTTLFFDALAEALVADRGGTASEARLFVRDAWIESRGTHADVRAGYGRLVWGKLDEVAPTDVINPIDTSRFLLEGRSEARLPVVFARGRIFVSERLSFESVIAPIFRRGVFDRLQETTSPFNLVNDARQAIGLPDDASPRRHAEPVTTIRNVSGGARVLATADGVDTSVSFYRGFDGLGPVVLDPAIGELVEFHPRFTMVGADMETATGAWVWRGEAAYFTERTLAARSRPGIVDGRTMDAGVGFDRRAGDFRLFGSALVHREWSSQDPAVERTDVSLVASIERTFARERYLARAFSVVAAKDAAAFLRGLFIWKPNDRVAVEVSGGAFLGTSTDTIGRFRTRDFVVGRLRWAVWP